MLFRSCTQENLKVAGVCVFQPWHTCPAALAVTATSIKAPGPGQQTRWKAPNSSHVSVLHHIYPYILKRHKLWRTTSRRLSNRLLYMCFSTSPAFFFSPVTCQWQASSLLPLVPSTRDQLNEAKLMIFPKLNIRSAYNLGARQVEVFSATCIMPYVLSSAPAEFH